MITVEQLTEEEYEKSLFIFVSHKWFGHELPDDPSNSKYYLCRDGIQQIVDLMAEGTQCYIWLDHCCLPKDEVADLVELLPGIMKLCDVMFTPILDDGTIEPNSKSVSGEYPTFLEQKPFKDYANRGWCRAEMILARVIPLLPLSINRSKQFHYGLENFKNRHRRPHIVYGKAEKENLKPIIFLPPLQSDIFKKFKPVKDQFSKEKDYETVRELMKTLRRPDPRNSHFKGDVDDNNFRQNGTFVFRNGDYYAGEFCGKMHGSGEYTFANGDFYKGSFVSGKRQGQGTMVFAAGQKYTGSWENDEMHGEGEMLSPNKMWIRGKWEKGKLDGTVEVLYPSIISKSFQGQYENGIPRGEWVCCDSDGRILISYKYDNAGKYCRDSLIDNRNTTEGIPSEPTNFGAPIPIEGLETTEEPEERELRPSQLDEVEELDSIEGLEGTEDVVESHKEPKEPELIPSHCNEDEKINSMKSSKSVQGVDNRNSEGLDELLMSQLDEVERMRSIVESMEALSDFQFPDCRNDKTDILLVWCLAFVLFLWCIAIFHLLI